MNSVSFEESVRRWSIICLECRQPCGDDDDVIQLQLGHVMHRDCYEIWLETEDACSRIGIMKRLVMPVVYLLREEKGLTREQIAQRRHETLYGQRRPSQSASAARPDVNKRGRPAAGSCNDGASAGAGGEDSREDVA